MRVVKGNNNVHTMLLMYGMVAKAPEVEIRGRKVRNVHNMAIEFDGRFPILTNFEDRKFNLGYAKKEWLWYLGADKYDDSICQHASMWQKLKQEDGSFYSNYGQYIFAEMDLLRPSQFDYCLAMLESDKNSRRASIMLLQPHHLVPENVDTVCTYAINFTIAENTLAMTVMMRSNDVIFGFTNDAFCFSLLMQYMYVLLLKTYPDLQLGAYTHFTNSMHVYEPHYKMIREIVTKDYAGFGRVPHPPLPTAEEVRALIEGGLIDGEHTKWLTS